MSLHQNMVKKVQELPSREEEIMSEQRINPKQKLVTIMHQIKHQEINEQAMISSF